MPQRAQRFCVDSREGFTFEEEREYNDKLDYEQEQADLDDLAFGDLLGNEDDNEESGDWYDDDDDMDTWTEWDNDNLLDYYDDSFH